MRLAGLAFGAFAAALVTLSSGCQTAPAAQVAGVQSPAVKEQELAFQALVEEAVVESAPVTEAALAEATVEVVPEVAEEAVAQATPTSEPSTVATSTPVPAAEEPAAVEDADETLTVQAASVAGPAPLADVEPAAEAVEEEAPEETLFERGIASTYGTGDGFQGNRTACGQIFDTYVPQVAHKTLPCGTMVRVEDPATGKSVTVAVTDRGPYIRGRVVDLSWAAYRELDPKGPGLLDVNVYLVEN